MALLINYELLAFAVTAIVFGGYSIYILIRHVRLLIYGKRLKGVVKDTVMDSNGDSLHLIVEYINERGEMMRMQSRASFFGWQNQIGKIVRLLYFPGNSEKAYIEKDLVVQYIGSLLMFVIFVYITYHQMR